MPSSRRHHRIYASTACTYLADFLDACSCCARLYKTAHGVITELSQTGSVARSAVTFLKHMCVSSVLSLERKGTGSCVRRRTLFTCARSFGSRNTPWPENAMLSVDRCSFFSFELLSYDFVELLIVVNLFWVPTCRHDGSSSLQITQWWEGLFLLLN